MKKRPMAALAVLALTLLCGMFTAPVIADDDENPTYGRRVNTIDEVSRSPKGSYDVYIDKPTGFAFVNTVVGWKFIRKLSDEALAAELRNEASLASR